MIEDPAVQQALAKWTTTEVMSLIDPEAYVETVLPERGQVTHSRDARTVEWVDVHLLLVADPSWLGLALLALAVGGFELAVWRIAGPNEPAGPVVLHQNLVEDRRRQGATASATRAPG